MYATSKNDEATKYYRLALERIDRMTDREKYRTRSGYYLVTRNQAKAIEELSALVSQFQRIPPGTPIWRSRIFIPGT